MLLATEKLMKNGNNTIEIERKGYKVTFTKEDDSITIMLQDKKNSNIYKKLVIRPFNKKDIEWFLKHPNWVFKEDDMFAPYAYEYTNSYLWGGKPEMEKYYPNTFFLSIDDGEETLEGTCLDPIF